MELNLARHMKRREEKKRKKNKNKKKEKRKAKEILVPLLNEGRHLVAHEIKLIPYLR